MGSRDQSSEEIAAKRIFESITYIQLVPNENGESGRVDYVSVEEGWSCAVEVTTHTNQQRAALINGGGEFKAIIPRKDLFHDWIIQTRDHPHIKKIRNLVIPQLHTLSLHGIAEYDKSRHEWWMIRVPTLEKTLSAFNSASVEYVKRQSFVDRDDDGAANVVLLPMLNWTFGGANSSLEIIENDKKIFPENVQKLYESGAMMRHLFVWLDEHSDREVLDAFNAESIALPTRAPKLPAEITHLWILNMKTEIGWYFEPTSGWQLVGVN